MNCVCGLPLHYSDESLKARVDDLVNQFGECVEVQVAGKFKSYLVPRHYIALHGLKAVELESLAEKYGFVKVVPKIENAKKK